MRLRMINELQKQEEVFACVLELSQMEQSQAIQSASQVVQQYILQSEVRAYVRTYIHTLLYWLIHKHARTRTRIVTLTFAYFYTQKAFQDFFKCIFDAVSFFLSI